MRVDNHIVLGRSYEDVITGFCGVATGFAVYITGCACVMLTPQAETNEETGTMKRQSGEWFDIDRLRPMVGANDIVLAGLLQQTGDDADGKSETDVPAEPPPKRERASHATYFGSYSGADEMPPERPRRD